MRGISSNNNFYQQSVKISDSMVINKKMCKGPVGIRFSQVVGFYKPGFIAFLMELVTSIFLNNRWKEVFDNEIFDISQLCNFKGSDKKPPLSLEFLPQFLHFANTPDLNQKLGER